LSKPSAAGYADRIAPLAKIAEELGQSLLQLAIRFALTPPAISTLTLAIGQREHIDAAVQAASRGPLDDETFSHIARYHVWTKNLWE
jgi:aryl-alcohol dehydrogenase-like predicted oxidoreductase